MQQAESNLMWLEQKRLEQAKRTTDLEARMHAAEERIRQLEAHIHYPNQRIAEKMAAIDSSAAQAQALPPMRSDVETIMKLKEFVERLAYGGDLEHYVPRGVNELASKALGRKSS